MIKRTYSRSTQYLSERLDRTKSSRLESEFLELRKKVNIFNQFMEKIQTATRDFLQPNIHKRTRATWRSSYRRIAGQGLARYSHVERSLGDRLIEFGVELHGLRNPTPYQSSLKELGQSFQELSVGKDQLDVEVRSKFLHPLSLIQEELKEIVEELKRLDKKRLDYDYCRNHLKKVGNVSFETSRSKFQCSKTLCLEKMRVFMGKEYEHLFVLCNFVLTLQDYHHKCSVTMDLSATVLARNIYKALPRVSQTTEAIDENDPSPEPLCDVSDTGTDIEALTGASQTTEAIDENGPSPELLFDVSDGGTGIEILPRATQTTEASGKNYPPPAPPCGVSDTGIDIEILPDASQTTEAIEENDPPPEPPCGVSDPRKDIETLPDASQTAEACGEKDPSPEPSCDVSDRGIYINVLPAVSQTTEARGKNDPSPEAPCGVSDAGIDIEILPDASQTTEVSNENDPTSEPSCDVIDRGIDIKTLPDASQTTEASDENYPSPEPPCDVRDAGMTVHTPNTRIKVKVLRTPLPKRKSK